jgi:hypothetical protein
VNNQPANQMLPAKLLLTTCVGRAFGSTSIILSFF